MNCILCNFCVSLGYPNLQESCSELCSSNPPATAIERLCRFRTRPNRALANELWYGRIKRPSTHPERCWDVEWLTLPKIPNCFHSSCMCSMSMCADEASENNCKDLFIKDWGHDKCTALGW